MELIEDIIYRYSQRLHQEMGVAQSLHDGVYHVDLDSYGCHMNGQIKYRNGKEIENTIRLHFKFVEKVIGELLANGYKDFNIYT